MLKKLLLTCIGMLVLSGMVYSQSGTLSGSITDETTGEELISVNVYLVEAETGAVTDASGDYEIPGVPYGTYTIRVTYIGYQSFESEIEISQQNQTLDIELSPDMLLLDDVVVTAMGVQQSRSSVGTSVQEIDADKLNEVQESNVLSTLGGKVSGVQVIGSSEGSLGGTTKIRIRGVSGLNETPPLIVIDGTPIDNESFTDSGTNPKSGIDYGSGIGDVNPQDIAKMTVLKGAAASALYGQRAAGGVVLITTKKGSISENNTIGITYNNSTSFQKVYLLPKYQNEYAGGNGDLQDCVDPIDGLTYKCLLYGVDESWGPRMEGQEYRAWWSWYPQEEEYGQTTTLDPQPDNIRDFFDTGVSLYNNLAVDFGNEKGSYRLSASNNHQNGILPNSKIDKTTVSFNGTLNLTDKLQSSVDFNYSNTDARERPDYGYSGNNVMYSFNQWFQRQVDMDRLEDYIASDGAFKTWNITTNTNLTPLYWDSPYFSAYENVPTDNREHLFGNVTLRYFINENISVRGALRRDTFTHFIEDRIATGGIDLDDYSVRDRSGTEDNYELIADYNYNFSDFSLSGLLGTNYLKRKFTSVSESTVGGLSLPNYYDIDASIDRPDTDSYREEKEISSYFGTAKVGYQEKVFVDLSLRNDNSSTLPEDNNSYWYGSASTSVVMTEIFPTLSNSGFLSYWKLRAGYGQVGNSSPVYSVYSSYEVGTPYGSNATMSLPDDKSNSELKPAISDEIEIGTEIYFLDERLYTDINFYHTRKKDEILPVKVSGTTAYERVYVNAGEFIKKGVEVSVGGTPIVTKDFSVNAVVNWSTNYSEVESLYPGITSYELFDYSTLNLYAREGEEWGVITGTAYTRNSEGELILNPESGLPTYEQSVDLGHVLPDWQGGLSLDFNYKRFGLHTMFEFQKGGNFFGYSLRQLAYSGLGAETVGNNALGNPQRNPVIDNQGNVVEDGYVLAENVGANSGGVLIEGVDENNNPLAYYTDAKSYWKQTRSVFENWVYDASYIKLRDIRFSYALPTSFVSKFSLASANVGITAQNVWLIWSEVDGLDPSEASNGNTEFSFMEGGQLPGVRSIGFNVNLKF